MKFLGAFEVEALYTARNSRIGFWTGSKRQKSIFTKRED